jgi:hypothetical protein
MNKILEFRMPAKAASGNVDYETPVFPKKPDYGLEIGIWDEELRERFRVIKRETNGEGLFVYILKKFN